MKSRPANISLCRLCRKFFTASGAAVSSPEAKAWPFCSAVTEFLWKEGVPDLTILWLGEPDLTQHQTALGAPPSLAAIKASDENLGRVLSALQKRNLRGATDVIVVSDHGFSTVERAVDLR